MRCSRPNCTNAHVARGLCAKHYARVPKGYVDAAPVIAHFEALRAAGLSRQRISELTGVHRDTLRGMGTWATGNVRVGTAQKVMSVRIPGRIVAGGTGLVDATGTRRRLQALRAAGWSAQALAEQLDCSESMVCKRNWQPVVRAATAAQVAELFDRLQLIPGPSERARRYAARNGWPPPLAWDDDIDDPAAQPDLGDRTRVTFAERYQELRDLGERNEEAIAKRLWNRHRKTFGVSPQSVIDMCNRFGLECARDVVEGFGPSECAS